MFIGCMKITTVLLFSVSCLVLAPAFYYTPGEPNWAAFAGKEISMAPENTTNEMSAIVGGAIPMLFVTYVTSPFVNYIHIKLPHVTIRTKDQLMRWAYKMPRNTEIDLTTMRFSGLPRVSRMTLADLRQSKGRFGVANLAKSSSSKKPLRPWWKGKVPKLFYVDNERVKVRKAVEAPSSIGKKAIWELVLDRIEKS